MRYAYKIWVTKPEVSEFTPVDRRYEFLVWISNIFIFWPFQQIRFMHIKRILIPCLRGTKTDKSLTASYETDICMRGKALEGILVEPEVTE
jgi:hypothetical protein